MLDTYKAPMDVAWQFDYAIDIEQLRGALLEGEAEPVGRGDAARLVGRGRPVEADRRRGPAPSSSGVPFFQRLSKAQREAFTAHATAQLLSQFLHGEQGALMTAATLTHAVPDYEAKLYGATQTMDEARHVEVYERYMQKLALVYPISPWLKELIDTTLKADHYVKILAKLYVLKLSVLLVQPLIDSPPPVEIYEPGTWGPGSADELTSDHGG